VVAVSTAGASPVLAARICREAAAGVDPVLPMLADLLEGWRAELKRTVPVLRIRRALLQRLAGEEMEAILRKSGAEAAQKEYVKWYETALAEVGTGAGAAGSAAAPASDPAASADKAGAR
jgi:siroheme synthase (precorrin-2 oxidase/ferrochelatase)